MLSSQQIWPRQVLVAVLSPKDSYVLLWGGGTSLNHNSNYLLVKSPRGPTSEIAMSEVVRSTKCGLKVQIWALGHNEHESINRQWPFTRTRTS